MDLQHLSLGKSALEKSEYCIKTAREAYNILTKESKDEAAIGIVVANLKALKEDGKFLKKSANDVLNKLVSQEGSLNETLQQIQREKQQFEAAVAAANEEKAGAERTLAANQAIVDSSKRHLETAQSEVASAEAEYQRAHHKAKKKKKKLRAKVGRAVGHRTHAEGRANAAKHNLQRRQAEMQSAQKAVTDTTKTLLDIQSRIQQNEQKIRETQQQADAKHKEIGSVKNSIALLRESTNFWEIFIEVTENARERTASLKRFVELAAAKNNYEILKGDGSVAKATSFLDAWETVASGYHF